ncbi:hypothetical protein FB475_0447 [Kribbella jejuensis]|uniref:Uncharacterized protein n=1 Tax=Kribbella jejuensis TaxID=236068 RepID=A0A542ELZ0_9ACTN|nr:hypothetical protein FB475_0447 [Kribbella jejuensis]
MPDRPVNVPSELENNIIDLTRVRTRWGTNPHYVNVDLSRSEIGYLELNHLGEVVRAVVHDSTNVEHRMYLDEIHRLAEPFVGAAAACASATG